MGSGGRPILVRSLFALAASASVQIDQGVASPDTTLPAVACDGDTVRAVVVRSERPPFKGHLALWRRFARSLGLHHATTREAVVRRFVTLEVGRPCTEFRRAESERLLRAQPFLASASVRTFADPAGGVRVEVQTTDEVPAVFDARVRRGQPSALTAGNENIFGLGVHAELRGERGFAYRDGFGGTVIHRHFLGRPYVLELDAQRNPLGGWWGVGVGHPFLTDVQQVAWHAGIGSSMRYGALTRGGESFLGLAVDRHAWDIGGVVRFGPPRQTWLFGGMLTGERTIPGARAVLITDDGFREPSAPTVDLPYESHKSTRVNIATGVRMLNFAQARGLDALTGTQDIARGVQVGFIAGRSLPSLGDDDLFFAGTIFGGMGTARSYVAAQIDGEARHDNPTGRWDGVIGSGRAAWYLKPGPAWTTILSVEGAAGWDVRVPFHLRLDDRQGGLRADVGNEYLGQRRVVARLEQRWIGGTYQRRGDYGLAGFVEAGRLWRGDAPFGIDIPSQTAFGISLLAAVPPGSQRLARLDIAFPISGPAARIVEFRVAVADFTRVFFREPSEVLRARAGALLEQIFSWP